MNHARLPLLLPVLVLLPGCLLVAGAAVGAGVVAATSEDTAQVDLRASRDEVFMTALRIVEAEGNVTDSNPGTGRIEGKVDGSSVLVKVFVVGDLTRVTVKSRQIGGAFADLDLAESLATDISRAVQGAA